MKHVFMNPYYHSATVCARLSVNAATLIWSLIVVFSDHALGAKNGAYSALLQPLDFLSWTPSDPEDIYGWIGLCLSAPQIAWLVLQRRPLCFGIVGYVVMSFFWVYLCLASWAHATWPLRPGASAAITVVAVLALYAVVVGPKPKHDHSG